MSTKWFCTICYHEAEAESLPEACPQCAAEGKSLLALDETGARPQSLEEVRDLARRGLKGICAVYPHCDGGDERICQREAYGHPIGFGGVGSGASFRANVTALDGLRLNTRLVGPHFEPDTSFDFAGRQLVMPVMGASTSGVGRFGEAISEVDFCRATIRGCREAGTLTWRGDTWFYTPESHPALDALEREGGHGIPIFKPRAQEILKRLIARAEKLGCPAVGVDLDGCGSTIMAKHGQAVFRKSVAELRELVSSTSLPFIAKGIMTPEDAEGCVEAGVRVVAVSNHGGRVLDATPGVAEVLPRIVQRVGGRVLITADGGVRTGYDVLKMLALGADAVLVGRDVARAAVGGGSLGVKLQMQRLHQTLRGALVMTGCPDLARIGPEVLG
jgi:isopentenyl diphosphate isomerase/L-lactate dehydrogenase-like FMN-dependent dehydrogenase